MQNLKIEEKRTTFPIVVKVETIYTCTVDGCKFDTKVKSDAEKHYLDHNMGQRKYLEINGKEYEFIYFKDEELFNLFRNYEATHSIMDRCDSEFKGTGWYSISSFKDSYDDWIGEIVPIKEQIKYFEDVIEEYKSSIEFINKLGE